MKPKAFSRVELGRVTHNLRLCVRNRSLPGAKRGRRQLQRLVERLYGCSSQCARKLVAHLEREGYLVHVGHGRGRGARSKSKDTAWQLRPTPNEKSRWLAHM